MIQEYQYVYEIYKEKSFTKAAKNLFISQPSLSASIKKLETQLGYKIFNRRTNTLSLTQEGELYLEAAKKIITAEEELKKCIDDLTQLEIGNLTISGSALFSSCVIPYIIQAFSEQYPKITLHFFEADSFLLYEEALKDRVDLIIDAGTFDSEQFTKTPLFYEHVLLAVPMHSRAVETYQLHAQALDTQDIKEGRHLLDDCPSVDLHLFREEPFVLLKNGHDMHQRAVQLCREAGFAPDCSIYLNQLMTTFQMASKGLGCTFITDTIIKYGNIAAPLYYFKPRIADGTLRDREVFIAYRRGCHITHAMEKFIHISQSIYASQTRQ